MDLDRDVAPIPNQWPRPKWVQNLIEAVGNVVGDLGDRRRMRSRYQNGHVVLFNSVTLPLYRCNKILRDAT